jgi:hypothetical protein
LSSKVADGGILRLQVNSPMQFADRISTFFKLRPAFSTRVTLGTLLGSLLSSNNLRLLPIISGVVGVFPPRFTSSARVSSYRDWSLSHVPVHADYSERSRGRRDPAIVIVAEMARLPLLLIPW